MTPAELIDLIRQIDLRRTDPGPDATTPYLEIRTWIGEQNEINEPFETLVRGLAREKLGTFPLDEIGAAVLAQIDAGARSST